MEDINNLLFIVTNGKLQVSRDDTLLLVITRRVPGKLENLSGEVLEDSSEVYCTRRQQLDAYCTA